MKIAVVGSREWEDYNTLIRKLSIEIEDWIRFYPDDNKLIFVHGGARGAENMVTEFVGKIQSLAKQNKKTITDKVFYSESSDRYAEIAMSDIDRAVIFQKIPCGKTTKFANIVQEMEIPTVIVKG